MSLSDPLALFILITFAVITIASVLITLRGQRGTYKRAAIVGATAGVIGRFLITLAVQSYFYETQGWEASGGPWFSELILSGFLGALIGVLCQGVRHLGRRQAS